MADDQPGTQNYSKEPGLTSEQNARAAKVRLAQSQHHKYMAEISMRGDSRMNPTLTTTITGTQSKFDRTYQTMAVVHRMSASGGYSMEITGMSDGSVSGVDDVAQEPAQASSGEANPGLGVIGGPAPSGEQ
jgi:hypothetical protein